MTLGIRPTSGELLSDAHVRHLRGAHAILAHSGLLEDFAAITDQPATMSGLPFKIEHEYARRKTPHLICIVAGEQTSSPLRLESLLGCVLLFEYRVGFCNTGFFSTGDSSGLGTVVAPPDMRARVAAIAARYTLGEGSMVLTSFRSESADLPEFTFPAGQSGLWATQLREMKDRLLLEPTYDRTLETLGKRTRTHLRYYRKRLEAETRCVFVPNAAPHISVSQLAAINASSLEPVSQDTFDLQFRTAASSPGGFIYGLRAADGRWLSLAGGWRQERTSFLQWQMNADGFRRFSLVTAFRAFLIAHEVSQGTTEIYFHGGTPHSIGHSFQQDYAVDLLLRRRRPLPSLLVQLIRSFADRDPAIADRGNFLIEALKSEGLAWMKLP